MDLQRRSSGSYGNGTRYWNFTLTATDLQYNHNALAKDLAGDGVLNSIALTFHLTAKTHRVNNIRPLNGRSHEDRKARGAYLVTYIDEHTKLGQCH